MEQETFNKTSLNVEPAQLMWPRPRECSEHRSRNIRLHGVVLSDNL